MPPMQPKSIHPEKEPAVPVAMKRLAAAIQEISDTINQVNLKTSSLQRAEVEKPRDQNVNMNGASNPCDCALVTQVVHLVRLVEDQNTFLHELIDRLEV